jgi:hypothetical protein
MEFCSLLLGGSLGTAKLFWIRGFALKLILSSPTSQRRPSSNAERHGVSTRDTRTRTSVHGSASPIHPSRSYCSHSHMNPPRLDVEDKSNLTPDCCARPLKQDGYTP